MTDPNTAIAYLQTKVMSAGPEELRLMLIDGAIKFATQGRDGLVSKDYEQSFQGFSQCRPILLELMTTINPEHDPELAGRVRSLYTFLFSELSRASMDKDVERINKVIALLEYERETWVMLMEKLASEKKSGSKAAVFGASAKTGEPKPHPTLSVQA